MTDDGVWRLYSFSFVGDGGTHSLDFEDWSGDHGVAGLNYVDNVYQGPTSNAPPSETAGLNGFTSAVPEPGAYALLGSLGLTGIAVLRRRRYVR